MFEIDTIVDDIMSQLPNGNILKITDISLAMQADRRTVMGWIKRGLLDAMQLPTKKRPYYITTKKSFREFLKKNLDKQRVEELTTVIKKTKKGLGK